LLSFASVYQAIRAENLLAEAEIAVLAIPTPREIDISCGQGLLFFAVDEPRVLALLDACGVTWSKLFARDGAARVYEKMKEFEG
jgi:hypothetical protein